jgi:glutamine cyclotransferase
LRVIAWAVLFAAYAAAQAPVHSYKIIATYPHDPKAFTEGLEIHDGALYESTGLNGSSHIRKVNLTTGATITDIPIPQYIFGEGITFFGNHLYSLTYKNGIAFLRDPKTFMQLQTFPYSGEGWALTHDAKHIIMSDGSAELRILDPASFHEVNRLLVREGTRPVTELNELEYIDGEIWANIWRTERIARIDPRSGQVNSWVDMTGLLKPGDQRPDTDVLNGIAYDPVGKRIFVTGKMWPKLFQIAVK